MSVFFGSKDVKPIYIGNKEVQSIYIGDVLKYTSGSIEKDKPNEYFYFKINNKSETAQVGFERHLNQYKSGGTTALSVNYSSFTNYNLPILEYSFDKISWSAYTLGSLISIGAGQTSDKVYFRGDNTGQWYDTYTQSVSETTTSSDGTQSTSSYTHTFRVWTQAIISGAQVQCNGNIMSLRYKSFTGQLFLPCDYAFTALFRECSNLIRGPVLPATTLTNYCYYYMFAKCTNLLIMPELPSLTMQNYCYASMFYNCSSLTELSPLPATTLATGCYGANLSLSLPDATSDTSSTLSSNYVGMFYGCTSITKAPSLSVTALFSYCYAGMFQGCTGLTSAPTLSATIMQDYCYTHMFYGCSNLRTPPTLPATTLAPHCYRGMFRGSGIVTAPTLPAQTMQSNCYAGMFYSCTSLSTPPALPATTLAEYCYSGMFAYSSITSAPTLSATTLATGCYGMGWIDLSDDHSGMFRSCTLLTTPPSLPATTLASSCYGYMFAGCTALTKIPKLRAGTLVSECYYYMFNPGVRGNASSSSPCTIAYRVPDSATASSSPSKALDSMFENLDGSGSYSPTYNTTFYINKSSF